MLNPLPFVVGGLVNGAVYGLTAMGIVFTYAVLVVIFSMVADVLYGILDPRIKLA